MEKTCFWHMIYAIYVVLKEKNMLSEAEFRALCAPLWSKIEENWNAKG